jgi:hypothetical protein
LSRLDKAYRMSETKNDYLNSLQLELRSMEERLQSLRKSDALPFSFFTESFNKIQDISRLLHELEWLQINEMKQQMEQLVRFLSETDQRSSTEKENNASDRNVPVEEVPPVRTEETQETVKNIPPGNRYAEGLSLPEYRNPHSSHTATPPERPQATPSFSEKNQRPVVSSLNDMVKQVPTALNLNRSISLNDRFLFQRALFHNSREEMNQMMIRLHAFEDFDRAERYLREESGWDFEDPVVVDFLDAIKRGFV